MSAAAQAHRNVQTTQKRKKGLLKMYPVPYRGIGNTIKKPRVTS